VKTDRDQDVGRRVALARHPGACPDEAAWSHGQVSPLAENAHPVEGTVDRSRRVRPWEGHQLV